MQPGPRQGPRGTWTAPWPLRRPEPTQRLPVAGASSPGPAAAAAASGTARGNPRGGGRGLPGAGSGVAPPGPDPGPARLTCDAGPGDALHHGFHGGCWGERGDAALLPASLLCRRLDGRRPLRVTPGSAQNGLVRPGRRRHAHVGHAHPQVGPARVCHAHLVIGPAPPLVLPQPQVGPAPHRIPKPPPGPQLLYRFNPCPSGSCVTFPT